jgi:hypothetical protein
VSKRAKVSKRERRRMAAEDAALLVGVAANLWKTTGFPRKKLVRILVRKMRQK